MTAGRQRPSKLRWLSVGIDRDALAILDGTFSVSGDVYLSLLRLGAFRGCVRAPCFIVTPFRVLGMSAVG